MDVGVCHAVFLRKFCLRLSINLTVMIEVQWLHHPRVSIRQSSNRILWSENGSLKFGLVRDLILLLTQTLELLSGRAYRVCCELRRPVLSVIRIAYWGTRGNIRNSCRITVLNGWNVCVLAISLWRRSQKVWDRQQVQAALLQIYVDSSEGKAVLLYTVKKSLWINFTISHFSILIKKQQLPLKKLILLRKTRIPGWFAVPGLNSKTWRCFWAFLCERVQCIIKHRSWRFVMSFTFIFEGCCVAVVWMLRLCDKARLCSAKQELK